MKDVSKKKCNCCRCNRDIGDFIMGDDGSEYKTCIKCRNRKNEEYRRKQLVKMVKNTDDTDEETDYSSDEEVFSGGKIFYTKTEAPKRGRAICKDNQQWTLDNRCYDMEEGELVGSSEQEYEDVSDVDSLFSNKTDDYDERKSKAAAELVELKRLRPVVEKLYLLLFGDNGITSIGADYYYKNKLFISGDKLAFYHKNKYRLGR